MSDDTKKENRFAKFASVEELIYGLVGTCSTTFFWDGQKSVPPGTFRSKVASELAIEALARLSELSNEVSSLVNTVDIYVSIGNSDDKLSQHMWVDFCAALEITIRGCAEQIYGIWYSRPDSAYQNMCIGFRMDKKDVPSLYEQLTSMKVFFKQDAIAVAMVHETVMV